MPKRTPQRPLSEAELEVLKLLWALGPSPPGRVRDALALQGRQWAYTTTKTILDRLDEKGYLRRDRRETPHVFSAAVSIESVAQARLGALRRDLFDGRDLPLVRTLLDGVRLSPGEIAELRASLDAMEASDREAT